MKHRIALVAIPAAEREIAQHRLRVLQTQRPIPPVEYSLAWPKSGLSPPARMLTAFVRAEVSAKGGLDALYSPASHGSGDSADKAKLISA